MGEDVESLGRSSDPSCARLVRRGRRVDPVARLGPRAHSIRLHIEAPNQKGQALPLAQYTTRPAEEPHPGRAPCILPVLGDRDPRVRPTR